MLLRILPNVRNGSCAAQASGPTWSSGTWETTVHINTLNECCPSTFAYTSLSLTSFLHIALARIAVGSLTAWVWWSLERNAETVFQQRFPAAFWNVSAGWLDFRRCSLAALHDFSLCCTSVPGLSFLQWLFAGLSQSRHCLVLLSWSSSVSRGWLCLGTFPIPT